MISSIRFIAGPRRLDVALYSIPKHELSQYVLKSEIRHLQAAAPAHGFLYRRGVGRPFQSLLQRVPRA
jgi:hypothetical protein